MQKGGKIQYGVDQEKVFDHNDHLLRYTSEKRLFVTIKSIDFQITEALKKRMTRIALTMDLDFCPSRRKH